MVIGIVFSLPAVGQGAVGIETREGDERIKALLAPLQHDETAIRVSAERSMNRALNGGCQVPIAGYAVLDDASLSMEGRVGSVDGKQLLKVKNAIQLTGSVKDQIKQAEVLGLGIADELLKQGAAELLAEL